MKKIKVFLLAALLIVAAGCEDFLDINKDPNNPSEPNIQQLLPGIQRSIGNILSYNFGYVGYANAVFTHQMATRQPEYDDYGISGSAYAVNRWYEFYAEALKDIELLISIAEEVENTYYAGIGKTLKAYLYSVMVDLWGDIPYSEANTKGIIHPVFDDDVAIYTDLLALLEEAYTDLNTEPTDPREPGNDDIIYKGNIARWKKANRTILLKLYTQVRKVDAMYNATKVNALLDAPTSLINSWAESFIIPYGTSASPDDRHPAFTSEYGGGQISMYISPWFYEIMNGENPNIFTGIKDPRIPYYFVNQKVGGAASENNVEYRNGDFISIYFGSTGKNRDHAGRATFTMVGIYPVGGKYDNNTYKSSGLGTSDGTGAAPMRLVTYADRLYLEAELISVGKRTGDAKAKLVEAINASMAQVDAVVNLCKGSQTVPAISSGSYVNSVTTQYDAASAAKKLEIIMTQKWISSWGSSTDQYTDYRRTGYPVLFDPENTSHAPGGFVTGGPDGSGPVPVQRTKDYPLSWPYDLIELTLNNSAPAQKTISTSRIFWDVVK